MRFRRRASRWLWPRGAGDAVSCGTENKARRDAWLRDTLARLPAGSRILDAGAGELQYKPLCAHLRYVSHDFDQYDGRGDGTGLQTGAFDSAKVDLVSDITNIPEPDASFDAIMCVEVLEHLPDPVGALRELTRLLIPGGTIILTAPFCSLTHYAPYFYQTGYSRYFYEYWLSELDYEVEEIDHNGNYFQYLAQELRRLRTIAPTYANAELGWPAEDAVDVLLSKLAELSDLDQCSGDVLCFGLHVVARKK